MAGCCRHHKVRGQDVPEELHLYLHSPWRENAMAGQVNLFRQMQAALPDWRLVYHPDTPEERALAVDRGYGLFHMKAPTGPRILCLRGAYVMPFWRIEAVAERWRHVVAGTPFDPDSIPRAEAAGFVAQWQPKLLAPRPVRQERFVLVPLQGCIREHRSFQSASPLAMLEEIARRLPDRPVVVTLHPKETYSPADRAALDLVLSRHPQMRLDPGPTDALLTDCAAVITQNSAVALHGFFADKPAILFAGSDFHHIAGSVWRDGPDAAFASLDAPLPEFARYLCWFFRRQSINGGAPDCAAQIRARLRQHGWPV
jgi:hypothetical protein